MNDKLRQVVFTRTDILFCLLLLALTLCSCALVAFNPLSLAPDESHYWEWSKRLDYSYYSKGPVVALLIWLSTSAFGDTEFAVRAPAIALSLVFSVVFYLFVRRHYGSQSALVSWIALRVTLMFSAMSVGMTTDPPLALCWLIALICAYEAVKSDKEVWWVPCFAFIGIGILAKYTIGLLGISFGLFLLASQRFRHHLLKPYFVLAIMSALLVCMPIVIWNSEHDWVNFAHNSGHLLGGRGPALNIKFLPELYLGQLGLVGPIIFVLGLVVLHRGIKRWRDGDDLSGLLAIGSIALLMACSLVSLNRRVYANWPMPTYIGLAILGAHVWHKQGLSPAFFRALKVGIALNLAIVTIGYGLVCGYTYALPGKILPTKKLVGWSELGAVVNEQIEIAEQEDVPIGFIATSRYDVASEIAFYSARWGQVYVAYAPDRRMNQYDIWGGWSQLAGKNALVVLMDEEPQTTFTNSFERLIPINAGAPLLSLSYGAEPTDKRTFHFWLALNYKGGEQPWPKKR